jgi:hypothetical protein
VRGEAWPVAQVVDVTEQWRSWRQVLWLREEMIEDVVSSRGIVGSVAALFVRSRRVTGVVQAGHRSLVIEGLTAPILQLTQEVVQSAVGAPVITDPSPGAPCPSQTGRQKVDVLSAGDSCSIVSCRLRVPHVTQEKGNFFVRGAQALTRIQTQVMGEGRASKHQAGRDLLDLRNVTWRDNSSYFGTPPAGIASEVGLTAILDG